MLKLLSEDYILKDEINKAVENNDEISGDADLSENAKKSPTMNG